MLDVLRMEGAMSSAERVILSYLSSIGADAVDNELDIGKKVEREHKDAYDIIKQKLSDKGIEMPLSEDDFYEMIAKAHLKEISDYYTRLRKMENKRPKEGAERNITEYRIMDTQTKWPVGSPYSLQQKNRARSKAEKMNQEFGAVRYSVQPIFSDAPPKIAMDFSSIAPMITPDKKMDERETARALRLAIAAEHDAAHLYELMADSCESKAVAELLQDIADEEKVHVGELQWLLSHIDKDNGRLLQEGMDEAREGLE
jgi:hypothetical protein